MLRHKASVTELTPRPFNVRSRVHEYGGAAYLVSDDKVFFVNFSDQNIYSLEHGASEIHQITHSSSDLRFADLQFHRASQTLICVQECHSEAMENCLVAINLSSGNIECLSKGHDFYSTPRLSPDSNKLLYLTWDHPHMPWDSTSLMLGDIRKGHLEDTTTSLSLTGLKTIAGGEDVSICQPEWLNAEQILYSSDESGWWNLKKYSPEGVLNLYPDEAEYGLPHWVFGMRFFTLLSENQLACVRVKKGVSELCLLDLLTLELLVLDIPDWQVFASIRSAQQTIYCIAGSPDRANCILQIDCSNITKEHRRPIIHSVLASKDPEQETSREPAIDPEYFSQGEAIEFITREGLPGFGIFYAPHNPDIHTKPNELPPLLVLSHGGPTDSARRNLNLKIQYYTSRGWAVFDSNYAGSTGFGRAYRQRLDANWGLADVNDCVDAVAHLAKEKRIDPERVAIKGGSAGGYTTLAALTFSDCFKAGASHYGIGDLEALAKDTHKFEARYLDKLVGKYPQDIAIYTARSPVHHTQHLNCPVIFFQGLDDKVVPPNQAEAMVSALKDKGLMVAYVPFEGEGHGFRRAENIQTAIESEYMFFSQVFGFTPANKLPDIEIFNAN